MILETNFYLISTWIYFNIIKIFKVTALDKWRQLMPLSGGKIYKTLFSISFCTKVNFIYAKIKGNTSFTIYQKEIYFWAKGNGKTEILNFASNLRHLWHQLLPLVQRYLFENFLIISIVEIEVRLNWQIFSNIFKIKYCELSTALKIFRVQLN